MKKAKRSYQEQLIAKKITNGLIAKFLSAVKSELKIPKNYRLIEIHTVEGTLTLSANGKRGCFNHGKRGYFYRHSARRSPRQGHPTSSTYIREQC